MQPHQLHSQKELLTTNIKTTAKRSIERTQPRVEDRVVREERMSTMVDSSAPNFVASLLALKNLETAPLT